jgi:dTDP-4-amino-4,6-dideoxy-D-galactose acyltransferase
VTAPHWTPLRWDSDHFGVPIGRVEAVGADAAALADCLADASAAGVRCLYALIDADDPASALTAQAAGFRVVDVRMLLGRTLPDFTASSGEVRTVEADDEEIEALEALARSRFQQTRFFADPHFDRALAGELYVLWLRRALSTPDRFVLAVSGARGFIVCAADIETGTGSIELVAVAPEEAGSGLGAELVRAAHAAMTARGMTRAEVVTQGRNLAAQRSYQACGHRTVGTWLWLHRWVDFSRPLRDS